jgi:magnesium chelatase family protein
VRERAAQRNGDAKRAHGSRASSNSAIAVDDLDRVAPLHPAARAVLRRELEVGRLSGRGLHRVRRVARTIADLDGMPEVVGEEHLATALAMRTGLATLTSGAR